MVKANLVQNKLIQEITDNTKAGVKPDKRLNSHNVLRSSSACEPCPWSTVLRTKISEEALILVDQAGGLPTNMLCNLFFRHPQKAKENGGSASETVNRLTIVDAKRGKIFDKPRLHGRCKINSVGDTRSCQVKGNRRKA